MKIVADANLALLDETFAAHGEIIRIPGREIRPGHLANAKVLLLRSVTTANAALLEGSAVEFVGTATIGTDHLDISWLETNGIEWASSPGCNADAAAQYTLAMAVLACERLGKDIGNLEVGIIGRGNVGSRLQKLLDAAGIPCVACDPPLAESGVPGLVSLREALKQPIVSLHVPLTRTGRWPTEQMIGESRFSQMSTGALLINTSRGGVIDPAALLRQAGKRRLHTAFDVWPGEPGIDPALLRLATVATPHVAGYSLDGKRNGTIMIYDAFLHWQGLPSRKVVVEDVSPPKLEVDAGSGYLSGILATVCGVAQDDGQLRSIPTASPQQFERSFDQLRADYRLRRDFSAWTLSGVGGSRGDTLSGLGFRLSGGNA